MTTLLEIKAAIEKLSPGEYAELLAMLHPPVDDDWDRQIKADVAAGRLDRLDPMVLEGASAARAGDTRHPNASSVAGSFVAAAFF